MRKKLVILSLLVLGCAHEEPAPILLPPPPPVSVVPVEPPKTEEKKEVIPSKPLPSKEFLRGYQEGYQGNWWGPVHNTLSSDFRSGRAQGKKDRKNGLPPQYPPPG